MKALPYTDPRNAGDPCPICPGVLVAKRYAKSGRVINVCDRFAARLPREFSDPTPSQCAVENAGAGPSRETPP